MKIIKYEPECISIVSENDSDKEILLKLHDSINRNDDRLVKDTIDEAGESFIIWKFMGGF